MFCNDIPWTMHHLFIPLDQLIFFFNCLCAFRHCFGPDSEFLRQLLFFFNAKNVGDFAILVETCRSLLQFVQDGGNFNQYPSQRVVFYKLFDWFLLCNKLYFLSPLPFWFHSILIIFLIMQQGTPWVSLQEGIIHPTMLWWTTEWSN